MANFDYNEYKKFDDALNAYYESLGFDAEAVWGIYEDLESLYNDFAEEEIKDFDKATEVIQSFVDACEGIRNAFFYPISVQECLQLLIMIATYPIVPSREYFDIENAAEEAVRIFHTHINHSGE